MNTKRTVTCGELRASDLGRKVVLNGWVDSVRSFGTLLFVDLRDRYGITQLVFDGSADAVLLASAKDLHLEYCVAVSGVVRSRPTGQENKDRATGAVEVLADGLQVFSKANPLPFVVSDPEVPSDEVRMRHRYLDLRRPGMRDALQLRDNMTFAVRSFLNGEGFWEIETPMLARSTPEGARDYLVPSRVNPGCFYALPQSPQQFKQLLMIAGCDKYYQMARCFRDEDLRADRQPEFTQIDIEMSFADRDDVFALAERLMKSMFEKAIGLTVETPFPRLSYAEAKERYASDKPDLRYGLEVVTLNDLVANCGFRVFDDAVAAGNSVRGIKAPGCAALSRKQITELEGVCTSANAKGMAWMKFVAPGSFEGPVSRFFDAEAATRIATALGAEPGDLLCFVADTRSVADAAMNNLRRHLGRELKLYDPATFHFAWVTDFPLFSWNEENQRYDSEHHPFTSPIPQDVEALRGDLTGIPSASYDLVINGFEIASGSVRIHDPEVQREVFRILKISDEDIRERFGFFIDALQYGTPPHAGIAFGFDRLVALGLGQDSIRDVIAFPKNTRAMDMMNGAPSTVDEKQLVDLHIRLRLPEVK